MNIIRTAAVAVTLTAALSLTACGATSKPATAPAGPAHTAATERHRIERIIRDREQRTADRAVKQDKGDQTFAEEVDTLDDYVEVTHVQCIPTGALTLDCSVELEGSGVYGDEDGPRTVSSSVVIDGRTGAFNSHRS